LTFDEIDLGLVRTLCRDGDVGINFGAFVTTGLTFNFELEVYFGSVMMFFMVRFVVMLRFVVRFVMRLRFVVMFVMRLMVVVMMMFTTGKLDVNFSVLVVTITISFKGGFEVSVVVWGVKVEGSRVVFVFVFGSAFFNNVNFFFLSARTEFRTSVFFTSDMNLFFYVLLSLRRGRKELLGVRRLSVLFLTFPSDALVSMW